MKKITAVLMTMVMVLSLTACGDTSSSSTPSEPEQGSGLSGTVSMSGSTSMEEIAKIFAEAFMEINDDVTVDVQLGGSSVGVSNVQDGISDIGNVSRQLKDSETGLTPHVVAIDGISVIVNLENDVEDLTMDEIAQVFKGEITNWSQLGGSDMPIVVIGREAGSGTRGAFEELLKVDDECAYAQELTETGAVKTSVQSTAGAIGYVSMSYADANVKALKVGGVDATEANAKSGDYVLQRPFIMVTKEGQTSELVQEFLSFVLGSEGQKLVASKNLITVS